MSLLFEKLDEQMTFLQGAISINKVLRENIKEDGFGEKYTKLFLEHEDLKMRIIEYESRECETCKILQEKLSEEKKSNRSAHHRLKSIASLLKNEEGSPLTHAKWSCLTQILEEPRKLEHDRKRKMHSIIDEIDEKSQIVKKVNSKLISETFNTSRPQLQGEIIIPETQAEFENIVNIEDILPQTTFFESSKLEKVQPKRCCQDISNKEIFKRLEHQKNSISSQNNVEIELIKDILNTSTVKEETSSPSIIKDEVKESGLMITNKIVPTSDSIKNFDTEEKLEHKKDSFWKLKPSTLIKMTNSGKFASESKQKTKFKQTTLAIDVKDVKKQDISSLQNFSGGIVNSFVQNSDEDSDVVFESPKNKDKKIKYRRKLQKIGTKDLDETLFQIPAPATTTHLNYNSKVKNSEMELMKIETSDLDETMFQPPVASTCNPVFLEENSFDRIPGASESPAYKYVRTAVRKKDERMKMPGWSCDECAKYYELAGQSWTVEELQRRMNICSRHRDKYQLRSKTPPGFWNPVIPPS